MSWSPASNDSPVSSGSEDSLSSEGQSPLQSVLVRVKIQEPSKVPYEKKVRFNSIVEVRFIPKVKSKRNSDKTKENKVKADQSEISADEENENVVVNGNDMIPLEETNKENSELGKNTMTRKDETGENRSKNETKGVGKNSASKSFDGGEIQVNVIAREGLCLPKVTIGQEYEGANMRTTKAVPKLQPRNSIHRYLRRGNNASRINSLNAKAVIHLERQAAEFYKEANAMLFGQDEEKEHGETQEGGTSPHNTPSKPLTEHSETFQTRESNRLYRSKSLPEFRRASLQLVDPNEAGKEGEEVRPMTEETRNNQNMNKLATSLPYINITPNVSGKTRQDSKESYSKLYLPQLHRRSEEMRRLNETVLKKKPKYICDKQPSSPNESISPLGFGVENKSEKYDSPPPASSHSIVRYSHGLDVARLLNSAHFFY